MSRSVMVIAGEVSGDMHLAKVIRAIKNLDPELEFWGIAGDACEREGVQVEVHTHDMAVMGIVEVLRRYTFFKRVFTRMCDLVRVRKPDAVLLVDYPGFNLRFAKKVKRMGVKVIYYVCPQVWAWNRARIPRMAQIIDRLLVIFPFEVNVFKDTGLRVDFVGHPLVSEIQEFLEQPLERIPWQGTPRLALLPGSRSQEVQRILPDMLAAASLLEKSFPGLSCILAAPNESMAELIRDQMSSLKDQPSRLELVVGKTREVLRQASAAAVTSGTATIETALLGCPMVVVYKTSPTNYAIGKRLVKVPDIGMVNIVAGRRICPELIQEQATPDNLAIALDSLLTDTAVRFQMVKDLDDISKALGEENAYAKTAVTILEELS